MKGWYGQGQRHALASRGIKTFEKTFKIFFKSKKIMTDEIWEAILWEGINEEWGDNNRNHYTLYELKLSEKDRLDLIEGTDDAFDKWNDFDIILKDYGWYDKGYIDLIDYDNGRVYIVKFEGYQ